MFQIFFQTKKGYSLIEALVYISIGTFLLLVITGSLTRLISIYQKSKEISAIESSALNAMDRIIREIRSADSVDTSSSCLYDPPILDGCDPDIGILKLNKVVGGVSHNLRFYVSEGRIMIDEDGVFKGPLTSDKTSIDFLRFRRSANENSEALRVEMSIIGISDPASPRNFYNTAVMRGSYR